MKQEEIMNRAAAHWSAVTQSSSNKVLRWWQSPLVWTYINSLLDSSDTQGDVHGGFHRLLKKHSASGKFHSAVSIGCGTGEKELRLLKSGVVEHFELYEISSERISRGLFRAAELGVEKRVRFIQGDAFKICINRDFDLVYWNNSLHHMLDVEQAITWSLERLQRGGLFAMDDYVGPSRFQWTDLNLQYATLFRKALPNEVLTHPHDPLKTIRAEISRPSIAGMIKADPTEAADSERIIPCIRRLLPGAKIIPTGGSIYHTGMNDVIGNLDSDKYLHIINYGLLMDRLLIELNDFQYAVCVHTV